MAAEAPMPGGHRLSDEERPSDARACTHSANDREPTLLNPDDPKLRYCRRCTVVVAWGGMEWVRVGGITKVTTTRGRTR